MNRFVYPKGNGMAFPIELTKTQEEENIFMGQFLCPAEGRALREQIGEMCDRMEYDGSLMYDEYPDQVSVEALVKKICAQIRCPHPEEISNRYLQVLVQTMLCNEMSYRRLRRSCHKKRQAGS